MGETVELAGRVGDVEVVVGFVFRDGVGEFAEGGDVAVEEGDEGAAGVLAREMREDEGGDVGVCDEGVDEADAGVVDYDYGVGAFVGDVEDDGVGVVVWVLLVRFWSCKGQLKCELGLGTYREDLDGLQPRL